MGIHIQGFSDHTLPYKWVDFKVNEKAELKLYFPTLNPRGELKPIPLTDIMSLDYLLQAYREGLLVQKEIDIPVHVKRIGFDRETYRRLNWVSLKGWVEMIFEPEEDLSGIVEYVSSIYEMREPPIRCPRMIGVYVYFKNEMRRGLPSDIYRVKETEDITLCAKVSSGEEPNCPYR